MPGLIPSTLKGKILTACVSALVLSLAGVATINYKIVEHYMEQTNLEDTNRELSSNARTIETWVKTNASMMEAAGVQTAKADDPKSALIQLSESADLDLSYLGLQNGHMTAHRDDWVPPAGYDPRSRGWYKDAVKKGSTVLTAPYADASSGELIVTLAAPVKGEQGFVGVIGGDILITTVIDDVRKIKPTPSSFAFLSTNGETLIAHPDSELTLKPVTEISKELTPELIGKLSSSADWSLHEIGGKSMRLKTSKIPGTDWELTLAIDEKEQTAGLRAVIMVSLGAVAGITILVSILLSLWLNRSFIGLQKVRNALEEISSGDGDLTKRLYSQGEDEVAQIAKAFNTFVEKLEGILLDIRDTTLSIGSAAIQITESSQDLSGRTESTAASLQQASASLEELTSTVNQTAESSKEANKLSEESSKLAVQGGSVVQQLAQTMAEIETASRQISEIVSMVDGIAFQTNLLALNASVEAARAGEHGKGFSVVASEVRNLAGRCADAAKEIKNLVQASAVKTESGSTLAKNAGKSMSEIVTSVDRVVDVLSEISAATQEQSQGIGQINIAVAELDRVTQQNSAQSGQFVETAAMLNEQTDALKAALNNFTLS